MMINNKNSNNKNISLISENSILHSNESIKKGFKVNRDLK